MRYIIKALPSSYAHIGDFIDLVPKDQKTVDLIKSKIREKKISAINSENKINTSTFNVKTKGQCFTCGKTGHHIKNCWHNKQRQYQKS
ncbi:hypothetical protein M0804_013226 [Polistes exclamans]|nr:hypothetical protein M0804_013226 [Polistes exclamans]